MLSQAKYSTFPAGPVIGDQVRRHIANLGFELAVKRGKSQQHDHWHDEPPLLFPTRSRPTSNWGFNQQQDFTRCLEQMP